MADAMEAGACECYTGDYEPVKHLDKFDVVVARKAHRCRECTAEIRKGTRYHVIHAIDDGGWFTFRRCLPCYGISRDYACGTWGGLREEIWERLGLDIVTGEIRENEKWWP